MKLRWLGPYEVQKVLKKGLYQLFNPTTSAILKKLVNQCRLTLYHTVHSSEEVQKVSKVKDKEEEEDRNEGERKDEEEEGRKEEKEDDKKVVEEIRKEKNEEEDRKEKETDWKEERGKMVVSMLVTLANMNKQLMCCCCFCLSRTCRFLADTPTPSAFPEATL